MLMPNVDPIDNGKSLRPRPTPLPTNLDEWKRNIKSERTLNDRVEDIHRAILADTKTMVWVDMPDGKRTEQPRCVIYAALLDAVYDEDAVEGSLATDNVEAARVIRDYARETINDVQRESYVAVKKLHTLVKALNVAIARYGFSRKERARMVGGEIVPNGNE
jgi:hypothetical protein